MTMQDNTELWERVQSTDPKFTKNYKGAGGFSGTAINATYLVKRATEQFGPIGSGWGYTIEDERFDDGGPLADKDGQPYGCNSKVHTIRIKLWYLQGGKQGSVEHFGHTPYVFTNKYGVQTDMEAPKKSLTDALKKCLSMLGFGADIHLGMYDDFDYVQEAKDESALTHAEDKVAEARRQQEEYAVFLDKHVGYIETSRSMGELEKIFIAAVRRAKSKKDDAGIIRLTKAKDAQKATLQQKDAA